MGIIAQMQPPPKKAPSHPRRSSSSSIPLVSAHFADVSEPASVDQAMQDIVHRHGKIDSLVTSAGFTENHDAVAYPFERVQKLWRVNVDGTCER